MKIGVPKETKTHEYRVSLMPWAVKELVQQGNELYIESSAGFSIGFADEDYISAGARIVETADDIYESCELIVKVKEPSIAECKKLNDKHILFTFLHLAAVPEQADILLASGCTALAYETVTDERGGLPILSPMSAIAGRVSVQMGAHYLETSNGGRGVLLGGVPGVPAAKVVVIGGGVVGTNAIQIALGMGSEVTVLDKSPKQLQILQEKFGPHLKTSISSNNTIAEYLATADLTIGCVLIPGASAPKVITEDLVKKMPPGSVLIDVAIDQGGCSETSRPTNFDSPTYVLHDIIHCCVTNLPGAVPRTSAFALNNVTLPFIQEISKHGYKQACLLNGSLADGLNVCHGMVTHKSVAESLGKTFCSAPDVLRGV